MTKELKLFIPIRKVDEERRIVYGQISAEVPDASGEIMDYATGKPEFQKWSEDIFAASGGKSYGNVRAMHSKIAAGKIAEPLMFDDQAKTVDAAAKIVDDAEWNKVLEGVYTGFSIGGGYLNRWRDPDDPSLYRYTPTLAEVSIVDNPCVPTATFEVIRANGASELRKFKHAQKEALESMTKDNKDITVTKQFTNDGVNEPAQVWLAEDGSTHPTKKAAFEKNAQMKATADTDPLKKAIGELSDAIGDKETTDEVSKAKDGEEKEEEVKKDDVEEAKKAEEADDKKDEEKPDAKKAARAEIIKLAKSEAWDARMAIDALCQIECLISCEVMDGDEGEASQIADLKAAVASLKAFIAAEIMENTMEMSVSVEDLRKSLKVCKSDEEMDAVLVKAGARHSKGDMAHMTKLSDHLHKCTDAVMNMHKCMKALGMEGHEMEDADAQKMGKLQETIDELNTVIKSRDESFGELVKTLPELTKRVKLLEKQPLPRKSAGGYEIVEKGHELTPEPEADETRTMIPQRVNPATWGKR